MADTISALEMERHIQRWLREAFEAGRDLCELQATKPVASMMSRVNLQEYMRKMAEADDAFAAKRATFLVLLNKAARWAIKWKQAAPEHAEIADAYLNRYKPSKDLRDILEHDDEYLTGGGRFPDRVMQTAMGGAALVSAFSTLIVNGEIFIGGTLSVQGMMEAAVDFNAALVALRNPTPSA